MSELNLKNHPIWKDFSELLAEIDCQAIAKQHLESCGQKISGYWESKDDFYEEIAFTNLPAIELVSSSIGINKVEEQTFPWIKLKFLLEGKEEDEEIGELTLILDTNLKVVDENWSVDVESPLVVATKQQARGKRDLERLTISN